MKLTGVPLILLLTLLILGCDTDTHSALTPHFDTQKMTTQALVRQTEEQGILPTRLQIPAIRLDAVVEPVGVLKNGHMGVPNAFDRVGILVPWTKPGQKGNAVIAGHLDHYTGPAVFFYLKRLHPGDKVLVSDEKGKRLTFVVKRVASFVTQQAPLDSIFGKSETANLNLITCTGKFNKKTQQHSKRLVVFTQLAE